MPNLGIFLLKIKRAPTALFLHFKFYVLVIKL